MLPAAATLVLSEISSLELNKRFDAAVLPTGLINHFDLKVRAEFVACARRHVRSDGWFFVERQEPKWLKTVVAAPRGESGGINISVEFVERVGKTVAMTLRYSACKDAWTHSFQLIQLEEDDLQELLSGAGFHSMEWLNPSKTWLRASRS